MNEIYSKSVQVIDKSLKSVGLMRYKPIRAANEAINEDLECVYIAIPKTGSTSVRSVVRSQGGYLVNFPHLNIRELRSVFQTYELSKELGFARNFSHDKPLSSCEVLVNANKKFDGFFKFSFVRNPWARAVSLYLRREGEQVHKLMSFDDFVENHIFSSDTCTVSTRHKNQIDWLVDDQGCLEVDFVGKIEELENGVNSVRDMTDGRIELKMKRLNVNFRFNSAPYQQMYTSHSRRLIEKRFEKDIDYFKYAF